MASEIIDSRCNDLTRTSTETNGDIGGPDTSAPPRASPGLLVLLEGALR
jgi:hypothetical protein